MTVVDKAGAFVDRHLRTVRLVINGSLAVALAVAGWKLWHSPLLTAPCRLTPGSTYTGRVVGVTATGPPHSTPVFNVAIRPLLPVRGAAGIREHRAFLFALREWHEGAADWCRKRVVDRSVTLQAVDIPGSEPSQADTGSAAAPPVHRSDSAKSKARDAIINDSNVIDPGGSVHAVAVLRRRGPFLWIFGRARRDLAALALQSGQAKLEHECLLKYPEHTALLDAYRLFEERARRKRRGVWKHQADDAPLPASAGRLKLYVAASNLWHRLQEKLRLR